MVLLLLSLPSYAQLPTNIQTPTSINNDGALPKQNAILDVQSSEKGILIPRMKTSQRVAISTPSIGLLVFDTDTKSFWFYNDTEWVDVSAVAPDADWLDDTNGIYNDMDNVAIGTTPSTDDNLLVRRDLGDFGAGKASIRAVRIGGSNANNGGTSWNLSDNDAAIHGYGGLGNSYSAGVYGAAYLFHDHSAAVIGVGMDTGAPVEIVNTFGALAYNDGDYTWGGYFDAGLRVKQKSDNVGLRIVHNSNSSNRWDIATSSSNSNLLFWHVNALKAEIASSDGAYIQGSDRSLKTDIEYLGGILPKINQLKPAKYFYKSAIDAPQKSHGFIAQEVQQIFPELVRENGEGKLALAYDDFAILAIQAIKEQQAEIESLKNKTEKVDELEQRLEKLEALLSTK